MDTMSPQLEEVQEHKRRMKFQSYRRQSAPSLVLTKALTRSKTVSRESFLVPVSPETCPLVQSNLAGSVRSFLLYGHAQLKTGMQTQDRHLFLFTDILLLAKAKSANHFKPKVRVCVCEMWTAACMDEVCEGSTNPERSFVMGWPTWNCAATFSTVDQKERWLFVLKSQIKEEKEKEEPKTIPLRVFGKSINTFAVMKTLPVSNSDSANEVIRLALQQFGIIGNVKDFQLWVVSRKDNTPYPLIGHEFPFSIHMSHVRSWQAAGRELPEERQCQFILKPRPVEPPQQHADLPHKQFKRRRSLIAWAFWRGSSPHLNHVGGASGGCLFAQPLNTVCVDGVLPKAVMEMLVFLYHEGPWTRGILRRPAGARAVRELRDSLDAGETHLPLTREHVFVIAGVFKDFLRSIPSSLLCCELHEEWTDVLEEEDEEEEQVLDVRRMIGRLPNENAVLLRHLLAVLHGIQGNAEENQMTSFNLSVCIAPSLLWPPGAPCSPEVEEEGTRKVCELVKFMIEHCEQILGQDPCSLFGGPPQRRSIEDTASESWGYPLTDSSYDSLENELDDSSGGSPGLCRTLRPKQGSLDSILTFSDYDQDAGPPSPSREEPAVETSLSTVTGDGWQAARRRSEPAIAYAARLRPHSSTALEASSTSPVPTHSSLDSLGGEQTSRQTPPPTSTPQTLSFSLTNKEQLTWGALKGLHPNSWLKKDRRLSLTQQDGVENEEHLAGVKPKPSRGPKDITDRGKFNRTKQEPRSPKGEKTTLFYSGPALSLFRPQRAGGVRQRRGSEPDQLAAGVRQRRGSEPDQLAAGVRQRRGSEPGQLATLLSRVWLPSDPGLKVSEVDLQGGDPQFCLSPGAASTVRDYFSSYPHSHPQSGQQVALALVESRREWLRQCNTPEADLEQLLFGEESYV